MFYQSHPYSRVCVCACVRVSVCVCVCVCARVRVYHQIQKHTQFHLLAMMKNNHCSFWSHCCYLSCRPSVVYVSSEMFGTHHCISTTKRLAGVNQSTNMEQLYITSSNMREIIASITNCLLYVIEILMGDVVR